MTRDRSNDVWFAALQAFEAGVEYHQRVLEGAEDPGNNPWPPQQLPNSPMPPEMQGAARTLVERADELTEDMNYKLAGLKLPQRRQRGARVNHDQPRWSTTL